MEMIDPLLLTKYAALGVAVVMSLNAVYVLGFARHRLKGYNCYIIFSIALVAARLYVELETGVRHEWFQVAVWLNLAVGSVIGLIGMMRLAAKDPAVWSRHPPPARAGVEPEDEVPVHDAKVLAKLDQVETAVDALTAERDRP